MKSLIYTARRMSPSPVCLDVTQSLSDALAFKRWTLHTVFI